MKILVPLVYVSSSLVPRFRWVHGWKLHINKQWGRNTLASIYSYGLLSSRLETIVCFRARPSPPEPYCRGRQFQLLSIVLF